MPFTTEQLAQVDAAILARITGGDVQAYSLPDGTSITLSSLSDLYKIRALMVSEGILDAPATARRVGLFSLRPFR